MLVYTFGLKIKFVLCLHIFFQFHKNSNNMYDDIYDVSVENCLLKADIVQLSDKW